MTSNQIATGVAETRKLNTGDAGADDETLVQSPGMRIDGLSHAKVTLPPLSSIQGINLAQRFTPAAEAAMVCPVNPRNAASYGIHLIVRHHAKGGMGMITVAYDQFLKREVALKELRREVLGDLAITHRFVSEAEITAQLEHPGIVPVHTLGLDMDGHPYYTMKLIRGRTLQDAIKDYHKSPDDGTLRWLIRRLVAASQPIAFAHGRGVIHRDIKPANIMLSEHNETLVMDWGLAKFFAREHRGDDLLADTVEITAAANPDSPMPESDIDDDHITLAGTVVGTPAFMSPEQATPGADVGPRTDVYGLGAILYAILTGRPPFIGKNGHEVLQQVRQSSPTPPMQLNRNIPFDLAAICEKAMARDQNERYITADDFIRDLCRWLDDEPIQAVQWTLVRRFRRWFLRRWQLVLLVALLAITSTALAVVVVRDIIVRDIIVPESGTVRQND